MALVESPSFTTCSVQLMIPHDRDIIVQISAQVGSLPGYLQPSGAHLESLRAVVQPSGAIGFIPIVSAAFCGFCGVWSTGPPVARDSFCLHAFLTAPMTSLYSELALPKIARTVIGTVDIKKMNCLSGCQFSVCPCLQGKLDIRPSFSGGLCASHKHGHNGPAGIGFLPENAVCEVEMWCLISHRAVAFGSIYFLRPSTRILRGVARVNGPMF